MYPHDKREVGRYKKEPLRHPARSRETETEDAYRRVRRPWALKGWLDPAYWVSPVTNYSSNSAHSGR
jgi:hypothetical protein